MTEEIDRIIKSGFYDSTVLTDRVCDMFYNEKVDTPWVRETVNHSYCKRIIQQASWPATTDFDRLVRSFDLLNSNGIIALHNAGNTRDEGIDDASDIQKELTIKNISCRGFCCYDTQDVDAAIDGNCLYLTFGHFNEKGNGCIQIGNEINATLQRCGFKTKWDQTCDARIRIEPFVWQKRFGNKNCTYEHAKELLSHNKSS